MQTEFDGVTLRVDGAVGTVTFSRPPSNYFDEGLISGLADALEQIDQADDLRAVVLKSEGTVFCAGANFSNSEGVWLDPGALYRKAARLFRTRKPIVAAIQGSAIGGGLGLAMMADFRVTAEEARFSGNFAKLGIHPGFGLTHILPRLIGHQRTALILYTGRRLNGREAEQIGLADLVVPLGQLEQAALGLAREIAEAAPLALEATRATLRMGLADAVTQQIEHEYQEQLALFCTKDFKEGVAAVNERRLGRWTRT